MHNENYYEDQVSESKAWRAALPEDLHTLTPRTNEAFERFKFIEPPHDLDAKFADFARQLELELNSANGRIAELTRKTPPNECPQESVALLCANHPNLAEYVAQMKKQIADLRAELRIISDHYDILRAELVEREARSLYGGFQAAACFKQLDTCRLIANARLRGKCTACNGAGTNLGGEQGAQYEECCSRCEGNGFVEIPDLSWLKNGKIQFHLLPKEHPDYDPTLE